ncbi:MAG: hypothetical protein A3E78_08780 [Alphaproteobacteria bacterium RIFCSPHIGHO2_12_FULL_63_12]|nr:MAG: hypothetical protein A3E78_08780 [Alphaproteobacteria bacterium RIFCSPHIGHO2_12_FULL_63_12]
MIKNDNRHVASTVSAPLRATGSPWSVGKPKAVNPARDAILNLQKGINPQQQLASTMSQQNQQAVPVPKSPVQQAVAPNQNVSQVDALKAMQRGRMPGASPEGIAAGQSQLKASSGQGPAPLNAAPTALAPQSTAQPNMAAALKAMQAGSVGGTLAMGGAPPEPAAGPGNYQETGPDTKGLGTQPAAGLGTGNLGAGPEPKANPSGLVGNDGPATPDSGGDPQNGASKPGEADEWAVAKAKLAALAAQGLDQFGNPIDPADGPATSKYDNKQGGTLTFDENGNPVNQDGIEGPKQTTDTVAHEKDQDNSVSDPDGNSDIEDLIDQQLAALLEGEGEFGYSEKEKQDHLGSLTKLAAQSKADLSQQMGARGMGASGLVGSGFGDVDSKMASDWSDFELGAKGLSIEDKNTQLAALGNLWKTATGAKSDAEWREKIFEYEKGTADEAGFINGLQNKLALEGFESFGAGVSDKAIAAYHAGMSEDDVKAHLYDAGGGVYMWSDSTQAESDAKNAAGKSDDWTQMGEQNKKDMYTQYIGASNAGEFEGSFEQYLASKGITDYDGWQPGEIVKGKD